MRREPSQMDLLSWAYRAGFQAGFEAADKAARPTRVLRRRPRAQAKAGAASAASPVAPRKRGNGEVIGPGKCTFCRTDETRLYAWGVSEQLCNECLAGERE